MHLPAVSHAQARLLGWLIPVLLTAAAAMSWAPRLFLQNVAHAFAWLTLFNIGGSYITQVHPPASPTLCRPAAFSHPAIRPRSFLLDSGIFFFFFFACNCAPISPSLRSAHILPAFLASLHPTSLAQLLFFFCLP